MLTNISLNNRLHSDDDPKFESSLMGLSSVPVTVKPTGTLRRSLDVFYLVIVISKPYG